jgi:hypothetical protein
MFGETCHPFGIILWMDVDSIILSSFQDLLFIQAEEEFGKFLRSGGN